MCVYQQVYANIISREVKQTSARIKCRAVLPDGVKYGPQCGKKQVKEARKRANGFDISRKTPHSMRLTYAGRAGMLQKILGRFVYSTTANLHAHMDISAHRRGQKQHIPLEVKEGVPFESVLVIHCILNGSSAMRGDKHH